MEPKIIAFTGVHGTGKTTAVNHLAEFLRECTAPDVKIGVINETARACPFPVYSRNCSKPSATAQKWIFDAQLTSEMDTSGCYIVVSDRSLVDCIAYTRYFGYERLANSMERVADSMLYRCRNIVFHTILSHDHLVDDGFRAMDVAARYQIEKIMAESYRRLHVQTVDSASSVTIPSTYLSQDLQDALKLISPWLLKRNISVKTISDFIQMINQKYGVENNALKKQRADESCESSSLG